MNENDETKMKAAEWRGYVKRALEDIDKSLTGLQGEVKATNKVMGNLKAKVGGIGALVAFVITLVTLLLKNVIFNGG